MKNVILILSLLFSFVVISQNDILIIERIYIDKYSKLKTPYVISDSNQTIKMVTDDEISEITTSKFSNKYKLNHNSDVIIRFRNNKIKDYFINLAIADSNKNVLYINIDSYNKDWYADYIISGIESDKEIIRDIKKDNTCEVIINYYQILSINSTQSEFIQITLIKTDELEKTYIIYNKKED